MLAFVYGTLKKGFYNHRLLEKSRFMGAAVVKGYQMYDLGSFPGIKESDPEKMIEGEVYEIDQKTLEALDRLEGEGSLYDRKETVAYMDDGTAAVELYVFKRKIERDWMAIGSRWEGRKLNDLYD